MNTHLLQRLDGIRKGLIALHASGASMSAATKGHEREAFVNDFLRACHAPVYRFGTGDVTDSENRRTGQLDIVVEYPFAPSITLSESTRLYLAESVAAVIEVKSDVAAQWDEVNRTATAARAIRRRYDGGMVNFGGINEAVVKGAIPFFAVGYTGWAGMDTVKRHLAESGIDGILVIDKGLFASSERLRGLTASGPWSLWGLICSLHEATEAVGATRVDVLRYAMQ